MLKFCAVGRRKSFSFASTIVTFHARIAEGVPIDESPGSELDIMKCLELGYALSKFIGNILLLSPAYISKLNY